tara:strand:- start:163 stop:492 length:330 start_codon:yes stop_codon:yes gene_type:complete
MAKIQKNSSVNFSLSFLVQLIGAIVLGVWAYSQLDSRISAVENTSTTSSQDIARIEEDMSENQDKPISSDHIQNTKLFFLENTVKVLRDKTQDLEDRLYEHNLRHTKEK